MISSNSLLYPEDVRDLESKGLLSVSINGKRTISSSTILTTSSSSSEATKNSAHRSIEISLFYSFLLTHLIIPLLSHPLISSSTNILYHHAYSDSYSFEVEIPDSLKSKETYVFLGLTIEMAEILWRRWLEVYEDAREPDGPVGFLGIATQHIRNQDNNIDDERKDWDPILSGWGLDDDLREAIVDPEFNDLRYTASAAF